MHKLRRIGICMIYVCSIMLTPSFSFAKNQPKQIDTNVRNLALSETAEGDSMIDLLIINQETSDQKRAIILHFCDVMLKKNDHPENKKVQSFYYDERDYRYDPRQSMFMYALCVNIDEVSKGREVVGKTYKARNYKNDVFENVSYPGSKNTNMSLFWKDDVDFNEVRGIPTQSLLDQQSGYTACNPVTSMQSCQFSQFVPTIFKNVINGYSNMKLATLYGYKYDFEQDQTQLANAISDFSSSYFGQYDDRREAPCNEEGLDYISSQTFEGDKKHCSHPKTYKELEETIKSAQRVVKKVKFFDPNYIMDQTCDRDSQKDTLHACAMSNFGDIGFNSDWQSFYNLYLNELMRYNLFLDYYSNRILSKTSYNPLTFGSITASYNRNQREAKTLQYEKAIAQQAGFQTMRMLANISTTYPIYIALRAYREDLVNYRNQVTKAYTPLHQLYYKFRNVQACQE